MTINEKKHWIIYCEENYVKDFSCICGNHTHPKIKQVKPTKKDKEKIKEYGKQNHKSIKEIST